MLDWHFGKIICEPHLLPDRCWFFFHLLFFRIFVLPFGLWHLSYIIKLNKASESIEKKNAITSAPEDLTFVQCSLQCPRWFFYGRGLSHLSYCSDTWGFFISFSFAHLSAWAGKIPSIPHLELDFLIFSPTCCDGFFFSIVGFFLVSSGRSNLVFCPISLNLQDSVSPLYFLLPLVSFLEGILSRLSLNFPFFSAPHLIWG